ncbi:MAG: hypothetical protein HRU19_10770 [Pseudobacteriovorax sp.]|nr:hypothetical protein [Pseudobacteriovorax sp.]
MAKTMSQSTAWTLAVMFSFLLFTVILTVVLGIKQDYKEDLMEDLDDPKIESEAIDEDDGKMELPVSPKSPQPEGSDKQSSTGEKAAETEKISLAGQTTDSKKKVEWIGLMQVKTARTDGPT